jgi:hypothetical protein
LIGIRSLAGNCSAGRTAHSYGARQGNPFKAVYCVA